jgi:hypothetical protein
MKRTCVCCRRAAGSDAFEVPYAHFYNGEYTGYREFTVCRRCAKRTTIGDVTLKMRAAYKRECSCAAFVN